MNNGKKYLFIGLGILVFLLILISILQSAIKPQTSSPTPTGILVPTPLGGGRNGGYQGRGNGGSSSSTSDLPNVITDKHKIDLISRLPIETDDFIISYSSVMDRIVITRKTPNAENKLSIWEEQNGYSDVLEDNNITIITNQKVQELDAVLGEPTKTLEEKTLDQSNTLNHLINTILNISDIVSSRSFELNQQIKDTPTPQPTAKPTGSPTTSVGTPKTYNGYVYYSQCHGQYDNYPLTSTCTVCRAGCGPTTVSMILSTYVDKKYDPPAVVEIYRGLGAAACGTRLDIAKSVLSSHGVKTSDYIIPYTGERRDVKEVSDDLRAYINNGWTIFVLATYQLRDGSWGGHYFWMTDISDSGNIMSFDPYYGMDKTPPINENAYYPSPKYLAAFGVKKQ